MSLLERFKNLTTGTTRRTLISSITIALLIPVTLLASTQRWELRKQAEAPAEPQEEWKSFVTVEFPNGLVGVSKQEEEARVAVAIQEKFGALKRYEVPEELKELGLQEVINDFVIIYTQNGVPIRPDLDALTDASQIGAEENNLTFTFDSLDNPWTTEEEAALRQHLESAYPVMKEIAGPPAFNITVNVRKITGCEKWGAYYCAGGNEIGICQDDSGLPPQLSIEVYKQAATHEMGHAFHDDAHMSSNSFEEGFAEAMSTEVDTRLGTLGELNKYHVLNMWYENQNKKAIEPWHDSFGINSYLRTLRYLTSGFVWSKIYIEHDEFFRSFHQDYYQEFYEDPLIRRDRERIKEVVKLHAPIVENMDFDEWFTRQWVLGVRDTGANELYSFFAGLGNVNALVAVGFSVGDWCPDCPLPDATINFTCEALFSEERICEGSMTTDETGLAYYLFPLDFLPEEPFVIRMENDHYGIEDETYGVIPGGAGLFGIAPESSGTLTATHGGQETTANVSNGKFGLLEPLLFRGRVDLRFEGESGEVIEKSATKDASPYFVRLEGRVPESLLPGDLDCDCDVDIVDIMRVAAIWNTREGEERFNPDYDFDKDGRISIADVMYVAAKWNTQCGE